MKALAITCVTIALLSGCDRHDPSPRVRPSAAAPTPALPPPSDAPSAAASSSAPTTSTTTLPFAYAPAGALKLLKETAKSAVLTPDGAPARNDLEPKLVLTRSNKVFSNDAKPRGPKTFITDMGSFSNLTFSQQQSIRGAGVSGFMITAKATSTAMGKPLSVFCAQLYAADGTYTALGMAPDERAEELFALYKQTVESIAPRK